MAKTRARETRPAGDVLRLIVADDHAIARNESIAYLNRQPDFTVVSGATDGQEAIELVDSLHPDAVVMDVEMPRMGGVEATRRIKRSQPDIVVVGFSVHDDDCVRRSMINAGADAFVSKNASAQELVAAIWRACRRVAEEP